MDNLVIIPVTMEWDGDGHYLVSCPALPAHTFGSDKAEATEMIVDAVEGFFDACAQIGALEEVISELGGGRGGELQRVKLDVDGRLIDAPMPNLTPQQKSVFIRVHQWFPYF